MEAENVTMILAFAAGLLSFLAPCILPLVPVYLSYLSGATIAPGTTPNRRTVFPHALAFVLGFSLVFVALGASVGLVGRALYGYLPWVRHIGGVVLIVFGLQTMGLLHMPLLYAEKRIGYDAGGRVRLAGSFLVGVFFAAGWTPCVGPILGGILLLASQVTTVAQGALLLAFYAAGLALPFLITALAWGAVTARLKQLTSYMNLISVVSGLFLILMGLLLITDSLARLSALLPYWSLPL